MIELVASLVETRIVLPVSSNPDLAKWTAPSG